MAYTQSQQKPTPKKMGRKGVVAHKRAQASFLAAFEQAANITESCCAANINRSTFYDWLEKDELFSFKYHQAEQIANDGIRTEIRRRAIEGVEEPLIYKGGIVYELGNDGKKRMITMRKYSDTLLIFLAKSRMPEFRDKQSVEMTGPDGQPLSSGTQVVFYMPEVGVEDGYEG